MPTHNLRGSTEREWTMIVTVRCCNKTAMHTAICTDLYAGDGVPCHTIAQLTTAGKGNLEQRGDGL